MSHVLQDVYWSKTVCFLTNNKKKIFINFKRTMPFPITTSPTIRDLVFRRCIEENKNWDIIHN